MSTKEHALRTLVGLALFGGLVAGSITTLRTTSSFEKFGVSAPANPVVAEDRNLSTRLTIAPVQDGERTAVLLDGEEIEVSRSSWGQLGIELEDLRPGYHLLETVTTRWGRKANRVALGVVAGPFVTTEDDTCDAQVAVSARTIERTVNEIVEAKALKELRKGIRGYFGPGTIARDGQFRLHREEAEFGYVFDDGRTSLGIFGRIALQRAGPNRISAHLIELREVELRGEARGDAQMMGAGGGAVLGGLLFGPIGLVVGAAGGAALGDGYAVNKARGEAQKQIRRGLREFSATELFPLSTVPITEDDASRLSLAFCGRVRIDEDGISARLHVRPEGAGRGSVVTPGPVTHRLALPALETRPAADVQVWTHLDAVNRVLDAWTASGVLPRILENELLTDELDATLREYTTLEYLGIGARLPPVLTPGGSVGDLGVGIGGLAVSLEDSRSGDEWTVVGGVRGLLGLDYDDDDGMLRLHGEIESLHLACEQPTDEGVALRPCFSTALDLDAYARDWSDKLKPGGEAMPGLPLRTLVAEKTSGLTRDGEGLSLGTGSVELDGGLISLALFVR